MKIFKFIPFFALLLPLTASRCKEKDFIVVAPACIDNVPSQVKLDAQFLGFCNQFFEGGSSKNLVVEITVDGLEHNPANQTISTQFRDNFNFTTNPNDANSPQSPANRSYPITLPRCGSFVVSVLVRGADGTCFKCCNGSTFTGTKSCSGSGTGSGTVRWRAVTTTINSSLTAPPPAVVDIRPLTEKCSGCGC